MMIDKPIKLPNHHSTLQTIGTNEFSGFPHWNLAIFRISGAPSALVAAQSDSLIKLLIPGLPQDGDSKWRGYKRYCSLVETPTWTVSVYGDFSFSHAVSQLSEFLAYRRVLEPLFLSHQLL